MFYYILYGKKFISDIQLFNIPQAGFIFPDPDVKIHLGAVNFKDIPEDNLNFYMEKEFAIVKFKYGAIRISFGNEIIYSVNEGYNVESITPYIMGWGMALVMTQMGYSAFHCSAIAYNDNCFFISGVSGAGKSTTTLELLKHGYKYLCDDIAIVDSIDNIIIPPAFPIQKICPDASITLDEKQLYSINNDRGKYSYLNTRDYCNVPKRLAIIFKLHLSNNDQIEIKEITGLQKFLTVLECLFLEARYALTSVPEDEKFRCLKIAGSIKVYTITRPKGKDTLSEITNSIIHILKKQEV